MNPLPPRRRRTVLLLLLLLLPLAGCGNGTRYIFSSSREELATPQRHGLAYREVWFAAEDGVRLHGWFLPGGEKPLVLFFHGNAANISHRVDNLAHLQAMGFPVFIFDYRGFGSSKGEPTEEADLARDARGAIAWLAAEGWQPAEMIYFGRSLGATVALSLALEAPPAGLVLESPFTSLPAMAWRISPVSWALFGWWQVDDRFDNLAKIDRLTVPLLIFHGDRDPLVPPAMSRKLFARARPPKRLQIVEGAGHSDAYLAGGESYRQSWLDFAASLAGPRQKEMAAKKK